MEELEPLPERVWVVWPGDDYPRAYLPAAEVRRHFRHPEQAGEYVRADLYEVERLQEALAESRLLAGIAEEIVSDYRDGGVIYHALGDLGRQAKAFRAAALRANQDTAQRQHQNTNGGGR